MNGTVLFEHASPSPSLDSDEITEDKAASAQAQPVRELTECEQQDVRRVIRGLFLYSDCDLARLEESVHDRRFITHLPTLYHVNRDQLVDTLEAAEKLVTIDLLALTVELRNAICKLRFTYINDSGLAVKH